MPSTFSPLKIQLMATGENNTTWGDVTNLNLGTALEEAIVGSADVTFASADVTLTLTDTNTSQTARNMRLRCTGTTGGSTRNLIVPSIEKPYIVKNDCADSVVVKTAAGTGITVPAGKTMWVYTDATNVVDAVTHLSSLTLGTDLAVSDGGTGASTFTANGVIYGNTTSALLATAAGTTGQVLVGNTGAAPSWATLTGIGVTSFSGGTTGLTPNTATTGAITLAGTLGVANGGTGTGTAFTAGSVVFAGASGVYSQDNANFFWDNTNDRLGIGTASPGERLTVAATANSAARITSTATTTALIIDNTNANAWGSNLAIRTGGVAAGYFGTIGSLLGNTSQDITAYADTGNGFRVYTNGNNERMRINSSGNVGIGTASPTALLNVSSAAVMSRFQTGSAADGRIEFAYNTTDIGYLNMASATQLELYGRSGVALALGAGGSERMRIDSSGLVGVGTSSPAARLDVQVTGGRLQVQSAVSTTGVRLLTVNTTNAATVPIEISGTDIRFTNPLNTVVGMFNSSGNLGVGTTAPQSALNVFGSSGLTLNLADTSWQTAAIKPIDEGAAYQGALALYTHASAVSPTNPTERMRINSAGNVGIGTNNPTEKLVLNSAGSVQVATKYINGNTTGVTVGAGADGSAFVYQAAAQPFIVYTNAAERMRILSGGNVGIGTSSPISTLDVTGSAGITTTSGGNTARIVSAASGTFFGSTTDTSVIFQTNQAEKMRINAAGNVGIGTTNPSPYAGYVTLAVGGSTGGALDFVSSAVGVNFNRVGQISAATGGTMVFATGAGDALAERMRIDASGSVGIGTASPSFKLDVQGNSSSTATVVRSRNNDTSASSLAAFNCSTGQGVNAEWYSYSGANWFGTKSNHPQIFITNNTERMRIDSSGNVGINTTAALGKLQVASAGAGAAEVVASNTVGVERIHLISRNTAGNSYIQSQNSTCLVGTFDNYSMQFLTNNTERMRIDTSGNVGIGTTTPDVFARGYSGRILGISSAGQSAIELNSATGNGAYFDFGVNGTRTASIYSDASSTDFSALGARILSLGTSGAAALVLNTNNTERMRIASSGNMGVGTTQADSFNTRMVVEQPTSASSAIAAWNSATTGDNLLIQFFTDNGAGRGSITYNRAGGLVAYNVTSDYRAKDIIGPVTDAGATIDALKVYSGKMKGATIARPMLVAHEAQEVVPYAVTGEKDAVNEDGTDKYQQMDHQSFIPLLIAEIQSLRARVAQLEGN